MEGTYTMVAGALGQEIFTCNIAPFGFILPGAHARCLQHAAMHLVCACLPCCLLPRDSRRRLALPSLMLICRRSCGFAVAHVVSHTTEQVLRILFKFHACHLKDVKSPRGDSSLTAWLHGRMAAWPHDRVIARTHDRMIA
jgi:hypothetical protein